MLFLVLMLSCRKEPRPEALRIGTLDALETLDPHKRNATGSLNVIRQMYEGLVLRDRNMVLLPGLAESWENPEENRWRFHIRRGVKFHTGKTLDAYDVEATFRRLIGSRGLQLANFASHISDIKVIDPYQIEITTARLSLPTLSRLLFVYIVPKNYADYDGKWDAMSVGTGPYRFVSWDGKRAVLESFPDYWGKKPQFSRVEFFVPPTAELLLEELRQNRMECAKLDGIQSFSGLETNYDIRTVESLYVVYIGFNLFRKQMLFASPEKRAELAQAIDRQQLVKEGRQGYASVTVQPVSPFVYGFNPTIKISSYQGESRHFPDHQPMRFLARQSFASTALVLQRQFERLELRTRLEVLSDRDFFPQLRSGNFDLFLSRWACDTADASEMLENCFYSRSGKEGYGYINYTGYSSNEVDQEIEESALLVAPEERLRRLQGLTAKILNDHPWIPLYVNHDVYAVSKKISWEPRMDTQINVREFSWVAD